jgi:hypothetical protein
MSKKTLIHAIADCSECDFHAEDYLMASEKARDHARNTGHRVTLEQGYATTFNEKSPSEGE